jgi:hypothetical protein
MMDDVNCHRQPISLKKDHQNLRVDMHKETPICTNTNTLPFLRIIVATWGASRIPRGPILMEHTSSYHGDGTSRPEKFQFALVSHDSSTRLALAGSTSPLYKREMLYTAMYSIKGKPLCVLFYQESKIGRLVLSFCS